MARHIRDTHLRLTNPNVFSLNSLTFFWRVFFAFERFWLNRVLLKFSFTFAISLPLCSLCFYFLLKILFIFIFIQKRFSWNFHDFSQSHKNFVTCAQRFLKKMLTAQTISDKWVWWSFWRMRKKITREKYPHQRKSRCVSILLLHVFTGYALLRVNVFTPLGFDTSNAVFGTFRSKLWMKIWVRRD